MFCPNPSSAQSCSTAGALCPASRTNAEAQREGICPAGSYCPNVVTQLPCHEGSYCPEGSSAEAPCDAGHFCVVPATRAVCGDSSHCPLGSTSQAPCGHPDAVPGPGLRRCRCQVGSVAYAGPAVNVTTVSDAATTNISCHNCADVPGLRCESEWESWPVELAGGHWQDKAFAPAGGPTPEWLWKVGADSCLVAEACPGGHNWAECRALHRGPRCQRCDAGAFLAPTGLCERCADVDGTARVGFSVASALLFALLALLAADKKNYVYANLCTVLAAGLAGLAAFTTFTVMGWQAQGALFAVATAVACSAAAAVVLALAMRYVRGLSDGTASPVPGPPDGSRALRCFASTRFE